jgi:hypothetical protein
VKTEVIKPRREVDEIEAEFEGMLSQRWSADVARQRFEVIWNEVNDAAVCALGSDAGVAYIALLGRMQKAFDLQYRDPLLLETHGVHKLRVVACDHGIQKHLVLLGFRRPRLSRTKSTTELSSYEHAIVGRRRVRPHGRAVRSRGRYKSGSL